MCNRKLCILFVSGSDHVLEDPSVKERELFFSDSVDTYPILALR